MTDIAPFFPAFPAISGKKVTAAFDGGKITSDAGVLLLAQAEKRLGIAQRLAALIPDARDPTHVASAPGYFVRYLAIAAGYDGRATTPLSRWRSAKLQRPRLVSSANPPCPAGRTHATWTVSTSIATATPRPRQRLDIDETFIGETAHFLERLLPRR